MSLGEAFIEVGADVSPFTEELLSRIEAVFDDIRNITGETFDEIPDDAATSFDEIAASAEAAAADISEDMDSISTDASESFDEVSSAADQSADDMSTAFASGADDSALALDGIDADFSDIETAAETAASGMSTAFDGAAEDVSNTIAGIQGEFDGINMDGAGENIEGTSRTTIIPSLGGIKGAAGKAGAAGAILAVGAAAVEFTTGGLEMNATLGNLAESLDITKDELHAMISEMINYTFSHEDAVAGTEALIQAGVREGEQLNKLLPQFDTFNDATGIGMVKSIQLFSKALSATGEPFENASDHFDTMLFLMKETDTELPVLERALSRNAEEVKELGLGIDGSAIAFAALADQGFKGREGVRKFSEVIDASEGDLDKFWEALGLTNEEIDAYRERIEGATGRTDKFAERNNAAIGPFERLMQTASNVMFSQQNLDDQAHFNEMIEALEEAIQVLLPIMIDFAKDVLPELTDAARELAPFISVLIKMWAGFAKQGIAVVRVMRNVGKWIGERVVQAIQFLAEKLAWLVIKVQEWWGNIRGVFVQFRERVVAIFTRVRDAIVGRITRALDVVTGFPGRAVQALKDAATALVQRGRELISGFIGGIRERADDVRRALLDLLPGPLQAIADKLGLASPSQVFHDIGANVVQGLVNGIEDMRPALAAEMSALTNDLALSEGTIQLRSGITPAQLMRGGGAGVTNSITVNADRSPEQTAQAVMRRLRAQTFLGAPL